MPHQHNNGSILILTKTKFAIQNGIYQLCRINTFRIMRDFVKSLKDVLARFLSLGDFFK